VEDNSLKDVLSRHLRLVQVDIPAVGTHEAHRAHITARLTDLLTDLHKWPTTDVSISLLENRLRALHQQLELPALEVQLRLVLMVQTARQTVQE
jgi:hypothetical protein